MTVIKICDYYLKTNLNSYDATEYIESKITDSVIENGPDFPFTLDDFIDGFIEDSDRFELMEDSNDWDVEFTPEEIDELVEQAALEGNDDDEEDEEEPEADDNYDDDLDDED
jgi:hypothetical protein